MEDLVRQHAHEIRRRSHDLHEDLLRQLLVLRRQAERTFARAAGRVEDREVARRLSEHHEVPAQLRAAARRVARHELSWADVLDETGGADMAVVREALAAELADVREVLPDLEAGAEPSDVAAALARVRRDRHGGETRWSR